MTDLDLCALIASRVCHDLINPIGAIHNGLELMQMGNCGAQGLEFDLVHASATDARARVEFFRLAFGRQTSGAMIKRAALINLCAPILPTPRYVLSWCLPDVVPRPLAQLIALVCLCFEKQMPMGGTLTITSTAIEAAPKTARPALDQWRYLTAGHNDLPAASDVQFVVLPHVAQQAGYTLTLGMDRDDQYRLDFGTTP